MITRTYTDEEQFAFNRHAIDVFESMSSQIREGKVEVSDIHYDITDRNTSGEPETAIVFVKLEWLNKKE